MEKSAIIKILQTDISQVNYADALSLFQAWLADSNSTRTVVAANVHLVTEASLHPDYAATIADADLVVPDGMPLVWASRLLGGSVQTRCYGPTLMEKSLDHFQNSEASHFFYGATPDVLEKLLSSIRKRWPNAKIAGAISPPFGGFDDAIEIENIKTMNQSGASFIWVGMGCPKQEKWMQRYRQHLDGKIILAVGAGFDFVAGTVRQAPPLLQNMGLEWLYRFAMEPRRLWKRYLFRNPYFIIKFTVQYIKYILKKDG